MLKPYMAFPASEFIEWAILVFANTAQEAKKIAYRDGEFDSYIDVRVRAMKPKPCIMSQMIKDEPHANNCPDECKRCEQWGMELNHLGICANCDNPEAEAEAEAEAEV